ncbi:MAG: DedA family protein, partial [Mesorhizobium sp.]
MTEAIHHFIEQYGLLAVFLGCVAEGESAAILGGFFAHQHVFVLWHAFA